MTLYTSKALVEESGATYRQIEYWTNQGWLSPTSIVGGKTTGIGNRRVYDDTELFVARSLVALTSDFGALAAAVRSALVTGAARVTPEFVLAHDEGMEATA